MNDRVRSKRKTIFKIIIRDFMHDVPSIGNDRRNVFLRGKQFLISNKFYFVTSFSRSRYILAFISYQTNFRLRRVSSNFNIPFYLTVVSHFEQCYSTVGRTRSFSLLLDSFKRDRKQMYIYIYIEGVEQLDELARITQLRALIGLRSWSPTTDSIRFHLGNDSSN